MVACTPRCCSSWPIAVFSARFSFLPRHPPMALYCPASYATTGPVPSQLLPGYGLVPAQPLQVMGLYMPRFHLLWACTCPASPRLWVCTCPASPRLWVPALSNEPPGSLDSGFVQKERGGKPRAPLHYKELLLVVDVKACGRTMV